MHHDFDYQILAAVTHRPWPMPGSPWVMTQTWNDLLFAHWPVEADDLRPLVPADFGLDLHDGRPWVSIVSFDMTNVAPRGIPSIPWVSEFPELNVRTYVSVNGKAGVFFFSLDAGSTVAVQAARAMLNLPYHAADMRVERHADVVNYESRRRTGDAEFSAVYEPTGFATPPAPGSLDYFLTERYCLYHMDHHGAPYRLEIHHPPWPLQPVRAQLVRNTMAEANGVKLPGHNPICHFVKRLDVVAWAPVAVGVGVPFLDPSERA